MMLLRLLCLLAMTATMAGAARAGSTSDHEVASRFGRTGGSSAAGDGLWEELVVPAASGPTAILDPVRRRVIVFGGYNDGTYANGVWALSLDGTPAWTVLTPTGQRPSPRAHHAAVYDPVRDRMIVVGGYDTSPEHYRNDVWELSLAGAPGWRQLRPAGMPPPGRQQHTAVYDPVRDRVLVFGGNSLHVAARNDAWALDLAGDPSWTALVPDGPAPGRTNHSAIYDPVRDRMLVFGGNIAANVLSDETWAFSLAATPSWTKLLADGPPVRARSRHCAAYDPARDRMLVLGGNDAAGLLGDVCALALDGTPTWATLDPTGVAPAPRNHASAIYDVEAGRVVTFGGWDGTRRRNDTWQLSIAGPPAWAELAAEVAPPGPRGYHSATYDPVRDRMLVFGGTRNWDGDYDDVWAISLAGLPSWTALAPSGTTPSGRAGHSAIYDPVRDRIVVFGGVENYVGCLNDVWALSLAESPAWGPLSPSGTPPSRRAYHSAVYDPLRDRMLVFGGQDSAFRACDDTWELSFTATPTWTALAPGGVPPGARRGHSAILDPAQDRMLVFGGASGLSGPAAYYSDVWALALSGVPAWTELSPGGSAPAPQAFHSAIHDPVRDRMLVYGAWTDADTWALHLAAGEEWWQPLAPANPPPRPRVSHSAVYDPVRDRMIVFGGGSSGFLNDTWALWTGSVLGVPAEGTARSDDYLRTPAPNPFQGETAVRFSIARRGRVRIGVYDLGGRRVRALMDEPRGDGPGEVHWDGTGDDGSRLGTGVYFVRLTGPGLRETRKVVLAR